VARNAREKPDARHPIVIENACGADRNIGTARIARATADGCTAELGLASSHALNGALYLRPYYGRTNAIAKT
jgi:tripartite-type tricarboxylate transporter receptor subunit TctC